MFSQETSYVASELLAWLIKMSPSYFILRTICDVAKVATKLATHLVDQQSCYLTTSVLINIPMFFLN